MKYCAFLRGVNVKGTNMKMVDAVDVFLRVGMKNVSSVLATGNIIFESDKEVSELKKILEKAMSEHFFYEAFLFIKSTDEVIEIYNDNPFEVHPNQHIYLFIGVEGVEKILMEEFEKTSKSGNEDAKIIKTQLYWQVEKGNTLDSAFGKILGKKNLKDNFTSRNLNTFEKIIKKIQP